MAVGVTVTLAVAVAIATAHAHPVPVSTESAVPAATLRYVPRSEVGYGPRVLLTFGSRQRRANQRAMNRSVDDRSVLGRPGRVVVTRTGFVFRSWLGETADGKGWRWHLCNWRIVNGIHFRGGDRVGERRRSGSNCCSGNRGREHGSLVDLGHSGKDLFVQRRRRFLLAPFRHTGTLIGVLRIARRTTRLFDVFLDHGDNRVVGDAALTWTVIVENVAQTQPALLHSLLPDIPVWCGWKTSSRRCLECNRRHTPSAIFCPSAVPFGLLGCDAVEPGQGCLECPIPASQQLSAIEPDRLVRNHSPAFEPGAIGGHKVAVSVDQDVAVRQTGEERGKRLSHAALTENADPSERLHATRKTLRSTTAQRI